MKKITIGVLSVYSMFAYGQYEGKVGINTDKPTETQHIKGTLRVEKLPEAGTKGIYTISDTETSTNADQVFTPVKTVLADANGVLRTVDYIPARQNIKTRMFEATGQSDNGPSGAANLVYTEGKENTTFDIIVFDGNSNASFILPIAVDGRRLIFYAWGGAGSSSNNIYKFTGTTANPLKRPSGSVSLPGGVSWTSTYGNDTLTLTQPKGRILFRYTKIEFVAVGESWFYFHMPH